MNPLNVKFRIDTLSPLFKIEGQRARAHLQLDGFVLDLLEKGVKREMILEGDY